MNTHDIEPMKYGGDKNDDYVTGWNDCFAAIEADRKRRGEPIANLWVNPETLEFEVDSCNHPIDELIPVYEAPQPAEPRLDAPAQVGPGTFGIGVKWSTVIRAAQRHHEYMRQPEQEKARMKKFGEAIKSIHPAEPVKVPSDDVQRDTSGETWMGMRVAAYQYIRPLTLPGTKETATTRMHVAHWSTAPSDAERLYRESDVRALLARYTTTKEQP